MLEEAGLVGEGVTPDTDQATVAFRKMLHQLRRLADQDMEFDEALTIFDSVVERLEADPADPESVKIRMELKTQAVLAHLRQEPPDWRRGQRTLEKLFSSQEKQRKQLLSDALNLVQKGKIQNVLPLLGRHSIEVLQGYLDDYIGGMRHRIRPSRLASDLLLYEDACASVGEGAGAPGKDETENQPGLEQQPVPMEEEIRTCEVEAHAGTPLEEELDAPGVDTEAPTHRSPRLPEPAPAVPVAAAPCRLQSGMSQAPLQASISELTVAELRHLESEKREQATAKPEQAEMLLKMADVFRKARESMTADQAPSATPVVPPAVPVHSACRAKSPRAAQSCAVHMPRLVPRGSREAGGDDGYFFGEEEDGDARRSSAEQEEEAAECSNLARATRQLGKNLSTDPLPASLSASDGLRRNVECAASSQPDASAKKSGKQGQAAAAAGGAAAGGAGPSTFAGAILSSDAPGRRVAWNSPGDEIEDSDVDDDTHGARPAASKKRKQPLHNLQQAPPKSNRLVREKFTGREEEFVRQGVAQFGRNWKKILTEFDFHPQRTGVDIKDKWRNMNKK